MSDWAKYTAPSGKAYYHNKRTNETTWTEPAGFVDTSAQKSSAAAGPQIYVQVTDKQGKVYYYNQDTNETVWVCVPRARVWPTGRHLKRPCFSGKWRPSGMT